MKKVIMYEKIYRDIITNIQNGVYKENDLLPSEKELAEEYGVSRITTNKAMNLLAKNGMIERIQGKGSFVSMNVAEKTKKAEREELVDDDADFVQDTIGVIVDNFDIDFGSNLVKGIEMECRRQNIGMYLCCTYGSIDVENKGIRTSLAHGAKGLILMSVQGEKYNDTILKLTLDGFPVVLVDREMKGIGIPCVKTDNYAATKEITEILIRRNHKKICFVTHVDQTTSTIEDRMDAFRDCVLEHPDCQGIVEVFKGYHTTPENAIMEYKNYDLSEIKEIIKRRKDCTAFFAAEYKMGVLFRRACEEMQLKREICTFVGLIGIFDEQNRFLHIKQDEYKIGVEAVKTLKKVMENEETELIINIPYTVAM